MSTDRDAISRPVPEFLPKSKKQERTGPQMLAPNPIRAAHADLTAVEVLHIELAQAIQKKDTITARRILAEQIRPTFTRAVQTLRIELFITGNLNGNGF